MNLIREIRWMVKKREMDLLLDYDSLSVFALESGLEAEVARICLDDRSYVLKVWNRSSKPNVGAQYMLLDKLYNQGISVSQPFGWGHNESGDPVILTSYDGIPVKNVSKVLFFELARILSNIHKMTVEDLGDITQSKYDFVEYFYPSIGEHEDIQTLLTRLVELSNLKQEKLIHGDINLGNIVVLDGKYTVIDWTNGHMAIQDMILDGRSY